MGLRPIPHKGTFKESSLDPQKLLKMVKFYTKLKCHNILPRLTIKNCHIVRQGGKTAVVLCDNFLLLDLRSNVARII